MGTIIEYNAELALGDEIVFYLDGEKFIGKVDKGVTGYWISFYESSDDHEGTVDKIFSHFGIYDKYAFRDQVIGRDWDGFNGIWPYTGSLEELKKMLDAL